MSESPPTVSALTTPHCQWSRSAVSGIEALCHIDIDIAISISIPWSSYGEQVIINLFSHAAAYSTQYINISYSSSSIISIHRNQKQNTLFNRFQFYLQSYSNYLTIFLHSVKFGIKYHICNKSTNVSRILCTIFVFVMFFRRVKLEMIITVMCVCVYVSQSWQKTFAKISQCPENYKRFYTYESFKHYATQMLTHSK